jgi:polysaccharide biosynthesis transport protein
VVMETSEGIQGLGLRHYLEVLKRRRWIVVFVLAISFVTALGVSLSLPAEYKAETKIVVGQGNSLFPPEASSAIQPFSATMGDLVSSNIVAQTVIRNLGLNESPGQLLKKTSVSINPETAVIKVSVVDHAQERARLIAQEIGIAFSALVKDRFGKAIPSAPGQAAQPPLTATIWDPAHVDPNKVSPRPVRNVAIAAVLGLLLGLVAAFLQDHFDRRLHTRENVERAFGLPVIAQIPFDHGRSSSGDRLVDWRGFGEAAEAYLGLRANLQYLVLGRPLRTILVTSASPEQGSTTVTANLGVAIARAGESILLVEADLRRPELSSTFAVDGSGPGLSSVLIGAIDLDDAIVEVALPPSGNGPEPSNGSLSLLPSGPVPPNPAELLSSEQMTDTLIQLSGRYDYVLVDSPPILSVADGIEIARAVDAVVLVARRNQATTDEGSELRSLADRLRIQFVGVIFNGAPGVGIYGGDSRIESWRTSAKASGRAWASAAARWPKR